MSKRSEIDTLIDGAKQAERELNTDELATITSLKAEVRGLNSEIDALMLAERKKLEDENADLKLKLEGNDEVKRQLGEANETIALLEASKVKAEEELASSSRSNSGVAEMLEEVKRNLAIALEDKAKLEQSLNNSQRQMNTDLSKALLGAYRKEQANETLEVTRNLEDASGFMSDEDGFLVSSVRGHDTTTEGAAIPNNPIDFLSIIGKKPIWDEMGVRKLPSLKGTITLPYKNPEVAQLLAEKANEIGDVVNKLGTVLSPERYQKSQLWSKEMIASEMPILHNQMIADLIVGVDRKITAEVYKKASAVATEVAAGALTKAGFDALQGEAEVEEGGVFASPRKTFFEAKGVKIDNGSGKFLVELDKAGVYGRTYEGVKYFYSKLFDEGAEKRVVYGDFYEIVVGDWGMFEIIVDPYSNKKTGQVEITVSRIASVACQNPAAFVKTPDLTV